MFQTCMIGWMCILVAPSVAIFPDAMVSVVRRYTCPNLLTQVRRQVKTETLDKVTYGNNLPDRQISDRVFRMDGEIETCLDRVCISRPTSSAGTPNLRGLEIDRRI